MTPDRCHWVRDSDGFEVLIPLCWDAVLDPGLCSCGVEGSRLDRAEIGRAAAESYVERLCDKLARATARYEEAILRDRRLVAEIRRLEAELESLKSSKS